MTWLKGRITCSWVATMTARCVLVLRAFTSQNGSFNVFTQIPILGSVVVFVALWQEAGCSWMDFKSQTMTDPCPTRYIKVNSGWIEHLNVRPESVNS